MSHYHSSAIIVLVLSLTLVQTESLSPIKNTSLSTTNAARTNLRHRLVPAVHADKLRNITASITDRLKSSFDKDDDASEASREDEPDRQERTAHVVVLTSLSGIYVWWPILFGGDDSFHLLLSQEEVPRFHDVTGDEHGNIYLTAPHERTVYRLQYSNGWWISNFSNHSVMNSIRSEMPLFVNIRQVSSILYVYGHSDIQTIDILERSSAHTSAPFMKRLRELSPNLRISDMIIDQLTADGYIIGDSYGWCTVIRCSLTVSECLFLFKIPSSYDNRPYPCTATIDFSTKIMYLSLEEKILGVHLNEQTNFDRRFVVTNKSGPRSTLGYDDIITHNGTILYTDVLRPLLHICTSTQFNPCMNISLSFPPPQRTILPLRFSIVHAPYIRPPGFDDNGADDTELHINQSNTHGSPVALLAHNTSERVTTGTTASHSDGSHPRAGLGNIWMLLIGVCIGLLLAGLAFMIYYITWNKNRPRIKDSPSSVKTSFSRTKAAVKKHTPPLIKSRTSSKRSSSKTSTPSSTDSTTNRLLDSRTNSSTTGSSEWTTNTTSSLSYQPDIVL